MGIEVWRQSGSEFWRERHLDDTKHIPANVRAVEEGFENLLSKAESMGVKVKLRTQVGPGDAVTTYDLLFESKAVSA